MEKDTVISPEIIAATENKAYRLFIDRGVSNCLKFISAIMIALHHYSQLMVHNADYEFVNRGGQLACQLFSSQGGYIGVAVFFFLSGYGLMESEQNRHLSVKEFIDRRLKRVMFPLVILALVWFPLKYGLSLDPEPISTDTVSVILHILNVGGWFVSAILMMYVAFITFTLILNKQDRRRAVITLSILTLIAYVLCDKLLGYYTPLSIPIFSVGILASIYKHKNYGIINYSLIYVLAGMVFSAGYCIVIHNSPALAVHSIINYVCIAVLIVLLTRFNPKIIFPVILGEASFDVYLIHKRVIESYMAIVDELINIWLWIGITIIATSVFVLIRKQAWKYYQTV